MNKIKRKLIPHEKKGENMNKKNCIDCKNLKAKIPIKKVVVKSKTVFSIKPKLYQSVKPKTKEFSSDSLLLDYTNAKVSCSAGMIVMESPGKEIKDKIFKNVLKLGKCYKNRTFKTFAEKCPFFESMDE